MKNHVWRPLIVVLGIVALILVGRLFVVPPDFGVGEQGYMYGYHRQGNQEEWKEFPVKYRTDAYCRQCHVDNVDSLSASPHGAIQCENCHGPAFDHPEDPETLPIDTSRDLCLRCHAWLPYPTSDRRLIPGIDPDTHNIDMECSLCHDPHNPNLEDM